jgi:glycosyltransferase involved in cell wall biosynthesis
LCELPELTSSWKRHRFEVTLRPEGGTNAHYFLVFEFAPNSGVVQLNNCSFGLPGQGLSTRSTARLEGRLERVNEGGIVGWAWDARAPQERLRVEILDAGCSLGFFVADNYRRDLEVAGKGDGRHGFRVPLPPTFRDGRIHEVSARVVDRGSITKIPVRYQQAAERPYRNWQQYLNWSMHHRQFHHPLQETDRQVLSFMARVRQLKSEQSRNSARQPLASVIMPAYNREGIIAVAISSVLRQTYENWELLVVDDGSADGTPNVVRSFGDNRIKLIELPVNGGVSAARNQGLRHSKGDVITYLDSDNTWHDDFLAVMVRAVSEECAWRSAYCAQEVTESVVAGEHKQEIKAVRFGPFNRALLENRNYIDLNAFVHTRKLFEELGGFNQNLRRLVDWDLILRYTRANPPCAVPCLLSYYFHGRVTNQITNVEAADHAEDRIDGELERGSFQLPLSEPATPVREAHPEYRFRPTGTKRQPTRRRPVSVVIVNFEAARYLDYCIQSVIRFTPPEQFELIVVDNASGEEAQRVLDHHERHSDVAVIRNRSNPGFTFASNQGISQAQKGRDIILLNNDALVTEGWLDAFQEPLEIVENIGLVVPRQTLLPHTQTLRTHVPFARVDREADVNISAHHNSIVDPMTWARWGFVELSFAPFFCVYITRECLNEAGALDADNGRHYRSDRLYCDIVRSHFGRRIIYTPYAKLYHFLQQSTKVLRENHREQFRTMFVENRWTAEDDEAAQLDARRSSKTSDKNL